MEAWYPNPAPPQLPQPGDRIAQRYLVQREIGRGGMGAVYEAKHEVTGRQVAIKWMLPTFAQNAQAVARFVREAKLAAAVDHENVVDIYDVGHQENGFYLVMEFLRGRSLADRLEEGRMMLPELVSILRGVCAGLSAAHAAGVVHRDLKPENIFLAEARNRQGDIVPKLVDFGVSKALAPGESHARLTGTNVAMGTPYYMSPEQIHSAADVGVEADIYSLGVIAYEALSGKLPFEGETAASIIVKVATEEPEPLASLVPGLPLAAVQAVHRAMAKRGADRFATADQFFQALASQDSGAVDFAHTVEMRQDPSTQRILSDPGVSAAVVLPQRSPLLAFFAIGVLGVLVAAGAIAWFASQPSVATPAPDPAASATPAAVAAPPTPQASPVPATPTPTAEAAAPVVAPTEVAAQPAAPAAPAVEPTSAPTTAERPTHRTRADRTTHTSSASTETAPTAMTEPTPVVTPMAPPPPSTMVGRLQTTVDVDSL